MSGPRPLFALVALSACVGSIADPAPGEPGLPPAEDPPACTARGGPVFTPIRRLTRRELVRTVQVLTGVAVDPEQLPPDVRVDGWDNDAQALGVNLDHVRSWQSVAEAVSRTALAPAGRVAFVGCDAAADSACLEGFVAAFGRRAYRRRLAADEVADLLEHARRVSDPWAQVQLSLEALLQAPDFVYRFELGSGEPRALTGPELATRLAYGLWQEPPDEALLSAAERGELDTADGVATAAARMLDDARARDAVRELSRQWLRVSGVEEATFDLAAAPAFTPELRGSALAELEHLADDHLWAGTGSALGLFTARYTWADARLLGLYGLPGAAGPSLERVELPAGVDRGGLFGTSAFAMATSKPHNTSVVARGVYVLDVLLCERPPPPPPGVQAVEAQADENPAALAARHAASAQCAACHGRIDPLGLGLEAFDPVGALRTQYANGEAVAAHGALDTGQPYTGARELGALVAADPRLSRCMSQKVSRWFLGRALGAADACTVEWVDRAFVGSGHRFRELVAALVKSDAFRFLPPPEPAP